MLKNELTADRQVAADAGSSVAPVSVHSRPLFHHWRGKLSRPLSSGEAARLIGVSDGYLRQLSISKAMGPPPEIGAERPPLHIRLLTSRQAAALLRSPPQNPAREQGSILKDGGRMVIIFTVLAVTNFKGGSGKTTTSVHLAQYLALQGYRVLAVDLDPQASLSALLGVLPETDVKSNETLYARIRYDEDSGPCRT